jgi:hypothetical protein
MSINMPDNSIESPGNSNANEDEAFFDVQIPEEEYLKTAPERIVKNFPYLKKVVGIQNSSDEEFVSAELAALNKKGLEPREIELEKTADEIEMIDFAKKAADEILSRFGGADLYDISLERIHVVKKYKTTGGEEAYGEWDCKENSIDLSRQDGLVKFAIAAFHEIVHSKVYNALQVLHNEKGRELFPYRNGLVVHGRNGKNEYSRLLNEAVLFRLEEIFFDEHIRNNNRFSEMEKRREIASPTSTRGVKDRYLGVPNNEHLAQVSEKFSQALFSEISKLPEYSEYKGPEDIVKLMIESSISGDVLKIGRMTRKIAGSVK